LVRDVVFGSSPHSLATSGIWASALSFSGAGGQDGACHVGADQRIVVAQRGLRSDGAAFRRDPGDLSGQKVASRRRAIWRHDATAPGNTLGASWGEPASPVVNIRNGGRNRSFALSPLSRGTAIPPGYTHAGSYVTALAEGSGSTRPHAKQARVYRTPGRLRIAVCAVKSVQTPHRHEPGAVPPAGKQYFCGKRRKNFT